MLIATTERLAGRRTVAALGLVLGIAVRRRGLGANIMAGFDALVGVRFDTAEVGHDMVEVVAYGTAVIVVQEPDGSGSHAQHSQ